MTDRPVLLTRLAEAETALHNLLVNKAPVTVSYDGESVTYAVGQEGRLRIYIRELETALGMRSFGRAPARRVIFG